MDKDRQEFERKYGSLPKDQPSFIRKKDPILDKVKMRIGNYRGHVTWENLIIEQNLLQHATFSFIWRIGEVTPSFRSRAEFVAQYEGNVFAVTFQNSITNERVNFKGIIDSIELIDKSGANSGYIVSGYSADVCIDDMPECQTYFYKSIEEVTKIIEQRTNKAFFTGFKNDNKYKKQIPYLVQYNETDFEFLQRLCIQYGEWMYYDGELLQIGNFKTAKAILQNGINLYDFHVKTKIRSHKFVYKGYDPLGASTLQANAHEPQQNSNNSFTTNTLRASRNNYNRKSPNFAFTSSAKNREDMERMQNLHQQATEAQATVYTGEAHIPLQIGGNVTIINDKVELKNIVTQVRHWSRGEGHYQNTFEAIPADVKAPPYANPLFHPEAKKQAAVVIDNKDPMGMGRVKVGFKWGHESDWLRMLQNHAGAGKGSYFIPELGEEVMLDFEDDNPELAFVLGANYNGNEISGYYTEGNDKKVIHTRSGTKIILNDAEGSVFIEDPSGNTYLMDGQGNINVNAPKNMTFTAGENVTISAGQNVTTTAGMNITESAGINHASSAGAMMTQNAVADYSLMAANIFEEAGESRTSKASEINEHGTSINKSATEGNVNLHGKKEVQTNSGEKSKFF